MADDILVIPASSIKGKIVVIGDVHGAGDTLQEVLNGLGPDDLLIVLGDLIDRGERDEFHPTSAEVLELFIQYQQAPAGTKPRVLCIQGNHEFRFLQVAAIAQGLKNLGDRVLSREEYDQKNLDVFREILQDFIKNGGAWIFKNDTEKRKERILQFRNYCIEGRHDPAQQQYMSHFIRTLMRSGRLPEELIPGLARYAELIKTFPYVIKIEGEHSVWLAHADLPFSDAELQKRIENKTPFSREERTYLTYARIKECNANMQRDSTSSLVLVGHNILDAENTKNTPENPATLPVRAHTNCINLDGAAYITNGFLVVDLKQKTVDVVGSKIPDEERGLLEYAQTQIQTHLNHLYPRDTAENLARDESEEDDEEPSSKRKRFM